ncbi:MAG: phage tail protein [Prochloraceae cyanobacterium]
MSQNGQKQSNSATPVDKANVIINDMSQRQKNYVITNHFYVEMQDNPTISASFSECSSLKVKINYETIREGGVNDQQRIILNEPEFSEITLKRGVTNCTLFWEWMSSVIEKSNQRRNINILLFNQSAEIMQCWSLIGAVPVGWSTPALQASANEVAVEELTLAYEGLKVAGKNGAGLDISMGRARNLLGYFS